MTPAQWLLSGTAAALAIVLLAMMSMVPPGAPVMLAPVVATTAAEPRVAEVAPSVPVVAAPVVTASELASRAMVALRGPGSRLERYCAAFRVLEAVPALQQSDPSMRLAWRSVDAAERQALREYQAAYEGGRRLLCRDGQISPSCSCHEQHRGCCSWHGGVRGCEPLPSRVLCPR